MPRSKAFRKILKAQSEANQKRDDDIYRHGVDAFGLNNLDDVPFIPEEMKRTLERREFLARKSVEEKVRAIAEGREPPNVSYEEGDQSSLKGEEAKFLRIEWATAMDYVPYSSQWLSEWLITIFCGDYEKFLSYLRGNTDEEIEMLLRKRESLLNVSSLFHVIIGARTLNSDHPSIQTAQRMCKVYLDVKADHMKIFIKLLSLGVGINDRDFAGFTPLHHCAQHLGNEVTLKMAERLIKAGADVNAKNRFGDTPLHECVESNKEDMIHLLVSNGADYRIKNNDGQTVEMISPPFIRDLLGSLDKKKSKDERSKLKEAAGGSFKNCLVCGKVDGGNKRCTGCYLVMYCSRECQVGHWNHHKEECKVGNMEISVFDFILQMTQSQYQTVLLGDGIVSGKCFVTGKHFARSIGDRPKKSHFVVKVQITWDKTDTNKEGLSVQNEDKLLYGSVIEDHNPTLSQELARKIKDEGVNGTKGYFYAILPKNGKTRKGDENVIEVKINTNKMLPVENW